MERRYYKQRVIPTPRAASCQKPLRGTLSSRATQKIDGARGTLAVGRQIGPFLKMTPSCQLSGTKVSIVTLWETGGFQKALYQHVDMVT